MASPMSTLAPKLPSGPSELRKRTSAEVRKKAQYVMKNPSAVDLFRFDDELFDAPVRANPFDKRERMRNGLVQAVSPSGSTRQRAAEKAQQSARRTNSISKYIGIFLIIAKVIAQVQKTTLPVLLMASQLPEREKINRSALITSGVVLTFVELIWLAVHPRPLHNKMPTILLVGIGVSMLHCILALSTIDNYFYNWVAVTLLHSIVGFSLILLRQAAVDWSLRTSQPRAPFTLTGQATGAICNISVMLLPSWLASRPGFATIIVLTILIMPLAIVLRASRAVKKGSADTLERISGYIGSRYTKAETNKGREPKSLKTMKKKLKKDFDNEEAVVRISFARSLSFLVLAFIGLNGEQILDEALSLRLKIEILSGQTSQAIGKYTAVLVTCSFAWASEKIVALKRRKGYAAFILLWGVTQYFRLYALGVGVKQTQTMWIVTAMVMLDKYTASLGESALEYALFIWCRLGAVRNDSDSTGDGEESKVLCICKKPSEGEALKRESTRTVPVNFLFAIYFILERLTKLLCQWLIMQDVGTGTLEVLVIVLTTFITISTLLILRYANSVFEGEEQATSIEHLL